MVKGSKFQGPALGARRSLSAAAPTSIAQAWRWLPSATQCWRGQAGLPLWHRSSLQPSCCLASCCNHWFPSFPSRSLATSSNMLLPPGGLCGSLLCSAAGGGAGQLMFLGSHSTGAVAARGGIGRADGGCGDPPTFPRRTSAWPPPPSRAPAAPGSVLCFLRFLVKLSLKTQNAEPPWLSEANGSGVFILVW